MESELAAAGGSNLDELRAAFQQEERAIEHQVRCLQTSDSRPPEHVPVTLSLNPSPCLRRSITPSTPSPVRWPSNPRPATLAHAPDLLTLNPSPYPASVDVSYNVRRLPPVEPLARTRPLPLTRTTPFARGSSSRTRRLHARTRTLSAKGGRLALGSVGSRVGVRACERV